MKLKYKKMVIIATVVAMALGFVTLIFLDNDNGTNSAEDARLDLNKNEEINKLIKNYFAAKKTVNLESLSELVSDANRIPKERYTIMAGYVEDYKDFNCYVIKNDESDAYRVYVKYSMKLKNIDSWVPCLTTYYIKVTSDGKYVIYLSALDEVEEEFIDAADKNVEIIKLKEEVKKGLNAVLEKDGAFKQFYQKMEKEISAATDSKPAGNSASAPASAPAASASPAASSSPAASPSPAVSASSVASSSPAVPASPVASSSPAA